MGFPPRKKRVATGLSFFFFVGGGGGVHGISSFSLYIRGRSREPLFCRQPIFLDPKKCGGDLPQKKPRNWRRLSLPIPQFFTAPNQPNNIPAECRRRGRLGNTMSSPPSIPPTYSMPQCILIPSRYWRLYRSEKKSFFCSSSSFYWKFLARCSVSHVMSFYRKNFSWGQMWNYLAPRIGAKTNWSQKNRHLCDFPIFFAWRLHKSFFFGRKKFLSRVCGNPRVMRD